MDGVIKFEYLTCDFITSQSEFRKDRYSKSLGENFVVIKISTNSD